MTAYGELGQDQLPRIVEIYHAAGWTAYLGDRESLTRAFERSLYALGAFREGRLIGFIRCVGDGEHIVYVQDLIVDTPYRRQGIGKALLRKVWERYPAVRMYALMTDASDAAANAFYQAMKMKTYEEAGLTGYLW